MTHKSFKTSIQFNKFLLYLISKEVKEQWGPTINDFATC